MELQLKLNEKETASLLNLIDIAVRAQGLKITPEAMVLVCKLKEARQNASKSEIEPNQNLPENGK